MEQLAAQYGYSVLKLRPVDELEASLVHLRHEGTGLELIWLDRREENQTFGIAFRTLPEDDTGVFHILEHSVLCGSRRFPVREPFVELLKSSMNTFLNAMTFPDKTFYPVSSRNKKDFLNLTQVYLDAVFCPNILTCPEIFMQEGWHYAFDESGAPAYQGVVYGEMKGAFANADQLLSRAANAALFPDTPYRFVSGGDPYHIPELSYGKFIECYRRFYTPSNAYVFLDGQVELSAVLALLDRYLHGAQPARRLAPPPLQAPVSPQEATVEYEASSAQECVGRDRLAWCKVIGRCTDREKMTAMQLLADVLCGNNHAPLSKAVLSRRLAEEVTFEINGSVRQPYVILEAKHFRPEDRAEIERVIRQTLQDLAEGGLDHDQLRAAMANMEFKLRERDYGGTPQGLVYGLQALDFWMNGGDPAQALEVGTLFEALAEKLEQGWFEQLLADVMLYNSHCCKVRLRPSLTCGQAARAAESQRLERISSAWSGEERASMAAAEQHLLRWQEASDPPEALAAMPALTLGDVSAEPELLPLAVDASEGVTLLRHDIPTGGVSYVTLYFDANDLQESELPLLKFTAAVLGKLGTSRHEAQTLTNLSRRLMGDLQADVFVTGFAMQPDKADVRLQLTFSTLQRNLAQAAELACEVLTQTVFSDPHRIKALLTQEKNSCFQQIMMNGASIALGRVMAQTDAAGVVSDSTGGVAYHAWLTAQEQLDISGLTGRMAALAARLAVTRRLTLSVTGVDRAHELAGILGQALPKGSACSHAEAIAPWGKRHEGVLIPADTSFACAGSNLAGSGLAYSGSWDVAARILSLEYLWNTVRVQGGAYGAGLICARSGFMGGYSYRDPHGARSLQAFRQAPEFLHAFAAKSPDLTGFIIGAVSEASPLMTARLRAAAADKLYFSGQTHEHRRSRLREMIGTTAQALHCFASAAEPCMSGAGSCVIGGKGQLDACSGLNNIMTL